MSARPSRIKKVDMVSVTSIDHKFTVDRATKIDMWISTSKGKGVLEFDAQTLMAMYCSENNLTIAVGKSGVPNDAIFIAYVFAGEHEFFPEEFASTPGKVRILFYADSIPDYEVRYYCPTFDITDDPRIGPSVPSDPLSEIIPPVTHR